MRIASIVVRQCPHIRAIAIHDMEVSVTLKLFKLKHCSLYRGEIPRRHRFDDRGTTAIVRLCRAPVSP
jgi:hypothetical protein